MSDNQNTILPEDQFSFKDIVLKLVNLKNLIVDNWKVLVFTTIIGTIGGYIFEKLTKEPSIYVAKIIFNMENNGGGGQGGLSELASAFGMGGGSSTGANLFSGDNFLELLKTKNLYNRAVLSRVQVNGKSEIFGNYYLKKSGILQKELEDDKEMQTFQFKHDNYEESTPNEKSKVRLVQNYLMPFTNILNESKKASFLTLAVTTRNDTLSYVWANLYLKIVTDFYKETKTQKTRELRDLIKNRVDSLKRELYRTQGAAARYADQNQQIIVQEGLIQQQRLQTTSGQLQGLYFEALKNLDNLNFSMAKETPLLTRIDDAELPISPEPDPTKKGLIIGSIIGFVLALIYVAFKKTLREISTK
ncbi:MAG: hypothetical protein MUF58_05695 [Arcicella sp.]|jgi:hypothetical protein|nr:hypothetical protein [Arcicella sp.]